MSIKIFEKLHGENMLSSTQVKDKVQVALRPLAEAIAVTGITPNALTAGGFVLSLLSSVFIFFQNFRLAALFFFLSGACDTLDGLLARTGKKTTKFGAFFDSFVDRYSDFAPLCAFSLLATKNADIYLATASLLSIAGSFSTSYARARAESLGIECKVGLLERPERFFIVLAALITGFILPFLLILAVFSNITALQRFFYVMKKLKET